MSETIPMYMLFVVIIIWVIITNCILVQIAEQAPYDGWKAVFYLYISIYEDFCDELNMVGIVILEILFFLLFLPGQLIICSIYGIAWSFHKLWQGYKWLFRKRDVE